MIKRRYLILRNEHIINMSDNGVQTSGNGVNPKGFTPEEVNEIKKKDDLIIDIVNDLSISITTQTNDCSLFLLWLEKYQT